MSGIGRARWLVALVAAVFVVVPAAAHAEVDTTLPELVAVTLPEAVDTGPAPEARIAVRVRDASGLTATGPHAHCPASTEQLSYVVFVRGYLRAYGSFERIGPENYEARLQLPRYAPAGTWKVEQLGLRDCAGNLRLLLASGLAAEGFPTTFEVRGKGDVTPPRLTKLTISPLSVDITAAHADVTVNALIEDDLSGVARPDADGVCAGDAPAIVFFAPERRGGAGATFEPQGVNAYVATVRVPRYARGGTWIVDAIRFADCAGNVMRLDADQLDALGVSTTFEVTGTSDVTTPKLYTLGVSRSVVDTRSGPVDVKFDANIVDDISGVATGATCAWGTWILLRSPSGEEVVAPFDGRDDRFNAVVTLPRFAEPGTWGIHVALNDCAGNQQVLAPADLAALGLPSTLEVLPPLYAFGGFMAPLHATELAQRLSGSAMAVKFTLGGALGTDVFDAGFPKVQPINCATREATGEAVSLAANQWVFQDLAGGLYHFKWKSSHDWQNVCRRLILGFDDGSRYSADVRFT